MSVRPGFGEDQTVAALVQRGDDRPRIEGCLRSERDDARSLREALCENGGTSIARQDECAGREHGVRRVDRSPARENRHFRRLVPAEPPSKLRECS